MNAAFDKRRAARDLAACCLLKLGRATEAATMLGRGKLSDDGGDALAFYYLGLADASAGKMSEAVANLRRAQNGPSAGPAAKAVLLKLLKDEARRQMSAQHWDEAGAALTQALEVDPTDRELQELLAACGDRLPVAYLRANRRADAAAAWEKLQREHPEDARVTHSLALLYYWWVQDLEAHKNAKASVAAWEGAIRNWVALAYSETFWRQFRDRRTYARGGVTDEKLAVLSRRLLEQLGRKIADYQNEYLAAKRPDDARRLGLLGLELAAEIKTAEVLRRVADSFGRQGRIATLPPICGALMLKHLGQLEVAQRLLALIEVTQTNETATEELHWCLSPWVFPWIMVEEKRYAEAIEHLREELARHASSEDGHDLMARALLGWGLLLAAAGDVAKALEAWREGLAHVRARRKIGEQIKQAVEKTVIEEATRLQREGGRAAIEKGVALLETARTIADTPRIRENLSEFYTTLGVIEGNDQSKSESIRRDLAKKHLETALKLNGDNGRAKTNLAIVLADEGVDLFNSGRERAAIEILRRAYGLAPGEQGVRRMVSRGLSAYGVKRWNEGARTEGDNLLREALQIDPTNDHARRNLNQGGGDLSDIEELLRRLGRR